MAFDLSVDVTRSPVQTVQSGTVRRLTMNTFIRKEDCQQASIKSSKSIVSTLLTFCSDSTRTFETANYPVAVIGVTRGPKTSPSGQARIWPTRIFWIGQCFVYCCQRVSRNGLSSAGQLVRILMMSTVFVFYVFAVAARLFVIVFAQSVCGCCFAQFANRLPSLYGSGSVQ